MHDAVKSKQTVNGSGCGPFQRTINAFT